MEPPCSQVPPSVTPEGYWGELVWACEAKGFHSTSLPPGSGYSEAELAAAVPTVKMPGQGMGERRGICGGAVRYGGAPFPQPPPGPLGIGSNSCQLGFGMDGAGGG